MGVDEVPLHLLEDQEQHHERQRLHGRDHQEQERTHRAPDERAHDGDQGRHGDEAPHQQGVGHPDDGHTKSVAGAVSTAFVALVFAIYVLLQKEKLGLQCRKTLYALLPKAGADRIVEVCRLSHRVFSSFITGQCVEAVILGAMFFVVMTVIRMPYALLVGCLIAVTSTVRPPSHAAISG